jgi:hypothetical protein
LTVSAEIVAIIAAAVAVFAAVLAVRAAALVARTVLTDRARQSREDPLAIKVTEGRSQRHLATDTRDYTFTVTVSNESPSARRFDSSILRVTYRTRANFLGAVDLVAAEPLVVPAGQSVSASLRFTTSNVIPRHCRIDAYTLLFTDSGGDRIVVDASLAAALQSDTDGTGSSTWGLD